MSTKKAKIKVQRLTMPGVPERYRIEQINGPGEVEIDGLGLGGKDRKLTAGDEINHQELLRLCDVENYEVSTNAPPR